MCFIVLDETRYELFPSGFADFPLFQIQKNSVCGWWKSLMYFFPLSAIFIIRLYTTSFLFPVFFVILFCADIKELHIFFWFLSCLIMTTAVCTQRPMELGWCIQPNRWTTLNLYCLLHSASMRQDPKGQRKCTFKNESENFAWLQQIAMHKKKHWNISVCKNLTIYTNKLDVSKIYCATLNICNIYSIFNYKALVN